MSNNCGYMKKVFYIFSFFFISVALHAQSGSGAEGDPYYGTISTEVTWISGRTVYIGIPDATLPYDDNDLIINAGGHLIIENGVTVIFKQPASDLIITGTGRLTADGTPEGQISFTRYSPANSYWGHISFQSMGSAGNSLIDNCIIEYGDVRSNSGIAKYGGGIYADFSNLTIKNSKVQNNKAEWGGGIFVSEDEYPGIENCFIYQNYAKEGGGGIYLWNRASSQIKNCIFQENHCDGTTYSFYTGGGLGSQSSGSIKILNSTFVNNTSSRTSGQSIMLYSSTSNIIINCLVWGNTGNHLYLSGTNTIQYTAVQGSAPSGTGNFSLSANNTDVTGPNFSDPSISDWSIKFISPCRDAGTTPSPALLSDYVGNPRIWTYDIGAYEVQYSRWAGTTNSEWSTTTNWAGNIIPSAGTGDVVVPAGLTTYPVSSSNPDFTIGSGKQMIIEQGAKVTLGNLTNNGIIKLNHNASGFASLIINSYTRGTGGSEEIQLYLTGGGTEGPPANYKWHYISSPVSSLSTDLFSALTMDLAQFVESRPSISLAQGWVANDGYVYSTGEIYLPDGFSSLTPGIGYNFWDDVNNTITFGGLFNTSNSVKSLAYSGLPTMHGFNLLGNPFSSGLNWNDIINSVYFPYPLNTSKGLYFTRDNIQCTYAAGVGVPGDVTGIIPPMQGFFVKTYSTGNSITLPNAARTHENIHSRYKGETIIPLVRLAIFEEAVLNDETVVRFDEAAKSTLDNDFDALKMFLSSAKTSIHTSLGGTDYAINGQPFPESLLEIPVTVNVISAGTHKISATQLQGLDSYNVSITDKTTGFTANLKSTPVVTFSASPGLLNDRFVLKINNISTENEDLISNDNSFNIYRNFNYINIQTVADEWDGKTGSVKVLDMSGKTVSYLRRTEFSKTSVTQIEAPDANGLYFIEIKSGVNRFVGKVVIK